MGIEVRRQPRPCVRPRRVAPVPVRFLWLHQAPSDGFYAAHRNGNDAEEELEFPEPIHAD